MVTLIEASPVAEEQAQLRVARSPISVALMKSLM